MQQAFLPSDDGSRSISRRSFLGMAVGTACSAMASACTNSQTDQHEPKQLNIYSWADYIHPDTIPEFQRRFGIRVVYDTFSSNEALLAKMQAGATAYDIIVPTSYMVIQLKKLNLLSSIDHDRLKGIANIIPRFRDPAFDRHLEHCIPYTWGTTGIGYSLAQLESRGIKADDWDVFWDAKLGGRITLLDDARETIGMAIKRRGGSYNTTNEQLITSSIGDLKAQKPLTMCYTSDQVIVQMAAGDSWLALAYSGDVYQAARDNKDVRYVIPASGCSLWLDNMCIPKTAPHLDNAYTWLSFMLQPEVAAATAGYTHYATPNAMALKLLSEETRNDKNLYPSTSLLDECDELGDIGSLIFLYDRMWTELKCV
jgi:spermidine/putrescine transport system substrate-binding protein